MVAGLIPALETPPANAWVDLATRRVSLANDGSQAADVSRRPSVNSDGSQIAFESRAHNLVSAPSPGYLGGEDIFVRDTERETTAIISLSSDGRAGDGGSTNPSISADGRFVAFQTASRYLDENRQDVTAEGDIYLRDRDTDQDGILDEPGAVQTGWLSAGGSQSNNQGSACPAVSADGEWVAFSSGDALVGADTNLVSDVYVYEVATGNRLRLSVGIDGSQATRASGCPTISADGRFVSFPSFADNLHPAKWNYYYSGAFVRDRDSDGNGVFDETGGVSYYYLNPDPSNQDSQDEGWDPVISADGSRVVFYSNVYQAGDSQRIYRFFRWDRATQTTAAVGIFGPIPSFDEGRATISDDGGRIAFPTPHPYEGDSNGKVDVYVWDAEGGALERASSGPFGLQGDGRSRFPALLGDGSVVAYSSEATNIMVSDSNGKEDVFAREVYFPGVPAGQTFGASCGAGSQEANPSGCNPQSDPVNTATGAYVTSVTDLTLAGVGLPFEWTRSYTSADDTSGELGRGWTHSYAASLSVDADGDVLARSFEGQQLAFTRRADGTFRAAAGGRSELTETGDGYELVTHDRLTQAYNTQGRLLSITDRNGEQVALTYTGGNLASIVDTAGRAITVAHNGAGLVSQVTLPDGRSVGYGYTGGLLTRVTDVRGGTTTYAYDADG